MIYKQFSRASRYCQSLWTLTAILFLHNLLKNFHPIIFCFACCWIKIILFILIWNATLAFINRIITLDEVWTKSFEPKLKHECIELSYHRLPRQLKVTPNGLMILHDNARLYTYDTSYDWCVRSDREVLCYQSCFLNSFV